MKFAVSVSGSPVAPEFSHHLRRICARLTGMKRAFLLPVATLALAACGAIPLGTVPIDDVNLIAPLPLAAGSQTLYLTDSLFSQPTPGGVNRIILQGNLKVSGNSGRRRLEFFIRSSKPDCPGLGKYALCQDTAGGAAIGQATVDGAQSAPLILSGGALDAAGKAGQGYLGVRLAEGSVNTGDSISATNLVARPYF